MLAAGAALSLLVACGTGETPRPQSVPEPQTDAPAYLILVGQPGADDVALKFNIERQHCIGDEAAMLKHVAVEETEQAVTVTADVADAVTDVTRCTSGAALYVPAPVALGGPLGTRRILDGSCTPPAEVVREGERREPCAPTELQKAQATAVGTWHEFDAGPLSPRGEPKGAWNGTELIVVGGLAIEEYRTLSDGAAYNPATRQWRRIPDLPIGRVHAVAPTGDGILALSHPGNELSAFDAPAAYAYSRATNAWRAVPPPLAVMYPRAFWTGDEVIVWGANGGAIFDPRTDRWRSIPPVSVDGSATSGLATSSVSQWIADAKVLAVQGDFDPRDGSPRRPALFLYKPSTNTWRKAADPPGSLQSFGSFAVGGTEVFDRLDQTGKPTLAYDAGRDAWREVDSIEGERDGGTAYFTGVDLGDKRGVVRLGSSTKPLAVFDLAHGRWSHAASPGRLPAPDAVVAWTGDALLLWGRPAEIHPGDRNAAWSWTPPAPS